VLPLFASKPLSMPRYFRLRAISACAVMATLHATTQLVGAIYFRASVPGFRAAEFFLAMTPHLFAAVFATALCAAIAGWVRRRGPSALLGVVVLTLLVGMALVGYYQPAWRTVLLANPIALGAVALGSLDTLRPTLVLTAVAGLAALTVATIAAGSAGVRRLEA
jgi:ABC-2 type transport system permease protein